MDNLFNNAESKSFIKRHPKQPEDLSLCVYTSRLIGKSTALVLHGGGNTSVKINTEDITGEKHDVIFVKGSGTNLMDIKHEAFVGLKLAPLLKLKRLDSLSDSDLDNQHKINKIVAASPDPSVETIVHAFLPHRYINHTHADSVLVLTHQKDNLDMLQDALGNKVAVLPYIMSGFPLAKAMIDVYEKNPEIESVVVINHGIFTFADHAKTAYDLMIDYVDKAQRYIEKKIDKKPLFTPNDHILKIQHNAQSIARFVQTLRGACSFPITEEKTRRFYTEIRDSQDLIDASYCSEAKNLCRSGILTPDHVIRTKNKMVYIDDIPENDTHLKEYVNKKIADFITDYTAYFKRLQTQHKEEKTQSDPMPRLFLVQ
jgi:rhamnose utilization protein RhaD (predicted bifunctional aldolase and dehydrogenase)